jgi:hypothetical protein
MKIRLLRCGEAAIRLDADNRKPTFPTSSEKIREARSLVHIKKFRALPQTQHDEIGVSVEAIHELRRVVSEIRFNRIKHPVRWTVARIRHLGTSPLDESGLIHEGHLRYLTRQHEPIRRTATSVVIAVAKMGIENDGLLLMKIKRDLL